MLQRRSAGGIDQQRSVRIFGIRCGGLHQNIHHIVQNAHDFRPGDGIRGPEIAVGRVRDVPAPGHFCHISPCIVRHLIPVRVGQRGGISFDLEGAGDHSHRLLAGNGVGRQRHPVVAQVYAGGMQFQDLCLPIGSRRIRKCRRRRYRLKFQKAIQNTGKCSPGDRLIRPERPVIITVDDPVLLTPLGDSIFRPVSGCIQKGGGLGKGQGSSQYCGQEPFRQLHMSHESPFLSIFVGAL